MKLPDSLRDRLKIPLGHLIPEDQANKSTIQKHLPKNSYLITVGDRTTEKMIDFGLIPSLQIIDNQEKRVRRDGAFEYQVRQGAGQARSHGTVAARHPLSH